MNKTTKFLSIIIIINIIISLTISVFSIKSYATSQTFSTEIDSIDDKKYPGIKSMIQFLQKLHPDWNFKLLYTGLDWEDVISNENQGHGKSPKNLVPANNASYSGDWICSECKTKLYDSGKWYCASSDALKYMMDPRNSLNESDIFQFLQLSYMECSYDDIKAMVSEYKYLNKKSVINTIINTGKEYDVNPYYIVARIIQEQGDGGNVLVTGAKYTGTDKVIYSGYYNIFNINASGNSTSQIYTNALAYAKEKEWTSLEKSIEGGITTIANNYIANGQDTLYFQKFNVSSTKYSYYTHQYMQNILAAQNEGTTLRKTFSDMKYLDGKYTFVIPVYENMQEEKCTRPSTTSKDEVIQNPEQPTKPEEETPKENPLKDKIKIDEEAKIITAIPEVKIQDVLDYLESKDEVKNNSKKSIDNTKFLGTGYTIGDKYTVVVLGDVNGDAEVDIIDMALIKRHINKTQKLKDEFEKAALLEKDSNEIDIIDMALMKRHISGTQKISF